MQFPYGYQEASANMVRKLKNLRKDHEAVDALSWSTRIGFSQPRTSSRRLCRSILFALMFICS